MTAPIRVAYAIDTMAGSGGSELNAVRTVEGLPRDRVLPIVLTLNGSGPMRTRYEAAGVRVFDYPVPSLVGSEALRQARAMASLMRDERIQVVHAHDCYTNFLVTIAARLASVPVSIASKRWTKHVFRQHEWTNRLAYRMATAVLANSEAVKRTVVSDEWIHPSKVHVIPNFLDDLHFSDASAPGGFRRQHHIPASVTLFTIVAQLRSEKAHRFLLDAFQMLSSKAQDVHLAVVGDGPLREELEAQVRSLDLAGIVTFVGHMGLPREALLESDVAMLVSDHEGFPNALIEGMAAGLPVIATAVGGVLDAVDDDETGLLVHPRDTAALARSMERLHQDVHLRQRLGRRAQQVAKSRYRRAAVLNGLVEWYEQLLGQA